MKEELEKQLVAKYPQLCRDYLGDDNVTCFAYGFECGDGWYGLIDEALGKIDKLAKSSNLNVKIAQLKSKFGELRLYIDIDPGPGGSKVQQVISQIYEEIDHATQLSSQISETSGKPATKKVINGWVYTATDEEAERIKNNHEI